MLLVADDEIFFFDGIKNITGGCSKNPSPSSYDSICNNFMNVTGYKFKDHIYSGKSFGRNGIDSVHLLRINKSEFIHTFRCKVRTFFRERAHCSS